MVQTIPAKEITLRQLRHRFHLERTDDEHFFREWQDELPELTDFEKQLLGQVKEEYLYLSESPLLEVILKMVIISPLLRLAGFYRHPFEITAEKEVKITSEDEGMIVTGRIDILIFHPEFWVTVIEAKGTKYALAAGIPQVLAYMLANPNPEQSILGFITNGNEFKFLKMTTHKPPKYAQSYTFALENKDDLYTVLRILKRINQTIQNP
ncbi:MAG: restriction endonuclease subunit R [Moorea sp. SIO1F2]|uniref:type I restriction endonuclease n=1 Tax=unclassified Moorena TaxID=2683338 RepID=UPI0013B82124|nr:MULTISPECIES: type I restriction endonuclease [unclassified Moorena]NEN94629.1 restriction endonuclease subunit R [Moorena sp. SIO3I7]NEO10081.1 restriction endonuclease subunit R [Moorena sp. SIO3I8]NEO23491.1 restriction endonuclease subunit R [Moorena sp. SIO4A5]NEP24937.1 restriction endonuclease subunit R [Moorena sp. SIO3I6]NEQ62080.1 restriction endonuclease subunit R [Moorena sp. SIO4A1]